MVEGNHIGPDVSGSERSSDGSVGADSGREGVVINFGAAGNTIGGTFAGARNIISGNNGYGIAMADAGTSGNLVEGDYIGVDQAGVTPLPNEFTGVVIGNGSENEGYASSNTVGGTAQGAANVISGNAGDGIDIGGGSGNIIIGDFIGTDADSDTGRQRRHRRVNVRCMLPQIRSVGQLPAASTSSRRTLATASISSAPTRRAM